MYHKKTCNQVNKVWVSFKKKKKERKKTKTIKSEENVGINLHDLGLGNAFLDTTSKHKRQENREKLDFIKIKNFCLNTITKVKS